MKLISVLFLISRAFCSHVVNLTPDNFDTVVDGSSNVLVKFFAPWCGHCKSMAPGYELVATSYANNNNIVIAEVDADKEKSLGSRFGVKGFPTLKWFPKGQTTPVDYEGGRDEKDFYAFIEKQTGIKAVVKKPVTFVEVLTAAGFDDAVLNSNRTVLVEFYAPWCGHCKNLAPLYEKVAHIFEMEPSCGVANFDATTSEKITAKYGVSGYPTIKLFKDGETVEYESSRNLDDFTKFLNQHCGTFRKVDGTLNKDAGRISVLDAMIKEFVIADSPESKKKIVDAAKKVASNLKELSAPYYVKALSKALNKAGYVEKETARLSKIIAGGKTALGKRDEFTIRVNILSAFAENEQETAETAKDEL